MGSRRDRGGQGQLLPIGIPPPARRPRRPLGNRERRIEPPRGSSSSRIAPLAAEATADSRDSQTRRGDQAALGPSNPSSNRPSTPSSRTRSSIRRLCESIASAARRTAASRRSARSVLRRRRGGISMLRSRSGRPEAASGDGGSPPPTRRSRGGSLRVESCIAALSQSSGVSPTLPTKSLQFRLSAGGRRPAFALPAASATRRAIPG